MRHQAGIYERYIKRLLDIVLSLTALIILSPIILVIALLVRIKLGSPVIFRQERPGKIDAKTGQEKIFTMYKFRSMADKCDDSGELLPDKDRLTKFGRVLRSSSLDELPELINILRGDMSFVGPRPLLVRYLPLYTEEEHKRHDVKPGLTGLAQVNGRNSISWDEKFSLDVKYAEQIRFLSDVQIVWKTIGIVFCKTGISSETSVTMEDFEGTEER